MGAPIGTTWPSVKDVLQVDVLPYLEVRGCATGRAAILGFCWGAWVVVHACGTLPDAFACGISAHPSVSAMASRWGEDEEQLLRAVSAPQLVLASKDEPAAWKPGGSVETLLGAAACGSVFREFGSMNHGFVPRGDMSDPTVAADVHRALEYTKGFLG